MGLKDSSCKEGIKSADKLGEGDEISAGCFWKIRSLSIFSLQPPL